MGPTTEFDAFRGTHISERYAAFVDLLGYGAQAMNDFEGTVEIYKGILHRWQWLYEFQPDVPATIYSDAILLTSDDLGPLIQAVNTLNMLTLMGDCLLRGGIGYGCHLEASQEVNTYVVSEAITRATSMEKSIGHPCVTVDSSVTIPKDRWDDRC